MRPSHLHHGHIGWTRLSHAIVLVFCSIVVSHTFSRNITAKAVIGGKYANIRLKQIEGNMNPNFPWITLHDAVTTRYVAEHGKVNDTYFNLFSSTCYYFGESLTEELGDDAPPIGLIHTAYGGSMIEQWLTQATVESCKNASNYTAVGGGEWWQSRVLPFAHMTLKVCQVTHCLSSSIRTRNELQI